MLIDAERSGLLVVDIQARLVPSMADPQAVIANSGVLLKAARRLRVPVLVSEQYPRGLGPTVAELRALLSPDEIVEKLTFSCLAEDDYLRRFRQLGREQAVIAGIEAHVCVLQTAADLLAAGAGVFVVADATSSRTTANHRAALARLGALGAAIVTTEMVVFEWLRRAGTPQFKDLSALIK